MLTATQPRQREIRVFVSSTFRDMQEEREELVKQIFPQLRRLCESRGVTWGEVDLRWGVSDEAKAEGKVLPLCLAEIEHCRPYFIGLLGERYGWVPEEIPEELLAAQPWLNEHRKQSVTALEILHGVLRNPKMAEHAFFYLRDPRYAATRAGFTEEDPVRRERLAALKDDIRRGGFPVVANFATPKQLGEWVLRDLTAVIEKLYPESSIPDPLDRAAADHEAYAASRRRVYIGRPEYIERLDAHAAGDGPPLVVLGESGGGKSALLANWAHRWRDQHPETPVIVHFIGAAPDSADWMAMLRRLLGEFQRRFGIQIEIPDQPDALRMAFANALHMAAARGRVVLMLDALNQIEDRDGAPDLVWLPPVIPSNVRLVVSTLAGRPLEDLRKRGWPVLTVEPLKSSERETLIVDYLKQYAKELSPTHRQRIAAAPQSANGLYLTTLLNELRLFGSHQRLEERIGWYLEAAGPLELYGKVIARWEQDYGMVREFLVRLWAARRGLSETEQLESLGTEGSPLPRAVWSPLFLAASDALVNRGGLLTFSHEFLREAVREACLPTVGHQRRAHLTLAEYFQRQPRGARQLDELPWQLAEAGSWDRLHDLLKDIRFLDALMRFSPAGMLSFWARVEDHSALRRIDAYAGILSPPPAPDMVHCLEAVAVVLATGGHHREALRLRQWLYEYCKKTGDDRNLLVLLGNIAVTVKRLGDLPQALDLYRTQLGLCRDPEDIQICLGNMGAALRAIGDLHSAASHFQRQEQVSRSHGLRGGLAYALSGQGLVLKDLNELDRAEDLQRRAEREARFAGDLSLAAKICGFRAEIHRHRKQLEEALSLHKEQERICLEIGDADELAQSLAGQGLVYAKRREFDEAFGCWSRVEEHARKSGHTAQLAMTLANRAAAMAETGNPEEARRLFEEAANLWRDVGNPAGLAVALANQAMILCGNPHVSQHEQAEIWRLAEEAFRLVRRKGLQAIEQRFDLLFRQVRAQLDEGDPDK